MPYKITKILHLQNMALRYLPKSSCQNGRYFVNGILSLALNHLHAKEMIPENLSTIGLVVLGETDTHISCHFRGRI